MYLFIFHLTNLIISTYSYYFNDLSVLYMIIIMDSSYYVYDLFYTLKKKQYDYVIHHLNSLVLFLTCLYNQHLNIILNTVFLFSISSPLLSGSKLLYKSKYNVFSKYCFLAFSVCFFITRIIFGFGIFYKTLYLNDNILILNTSILYSIQLYWFYKILCFIKKLI